MTWNYRIIHYKDGGYGLHEVFYKKEGKIDGWTQQPINFVCEEEEGSQSIMESLWVALKDCSLPVLEEKDIE